MVFAIQIHLLLIQNYEDKLHYEKDKKLNLADTPGSAFQTNLHFNFSPSD